MELPASGHKTVKHDAKPATCTEAGWNAYETCENCDHTTYVEIPATDHNYVEQIIEPTCTKDGCTLHTCTNCNDSYTTNPTKKLYHWFAEWSTIQHSLHIRPQYMVFVIHNNNYISNPVSVVKNEIP